LILGGASAIAIAYARARAADGPSFVLVGRHEERLAAVAADLVARGAGSADTVVVDLAAADDIAPRMRMIRSRFGEPDEILVAYGLLGDQDAAERNLAEARSIIDVNFTSAALWLLAAFHDRDPAAPLTVVVIGSVAGDRGRAGNFIYGAAKGALELFVEGMRHKYQSDMVRFVFVKPGFVDTPMTDVFAKSGPLWSSPERIAADIQRAVAGGKHVVYAPWFWWPIMSAIRHLPWFVFKRLRI
jgi:decaprenylphospho-beta-D-erythro-pentofuranosid-2-ulose 2-reductase